ncbi:MAG: polyamine aminopropyltransferase [Gammaproteobacteria bacterium]
MSKFVEKLHGEDTFQGFEVTREVVSSKTPFQELQIFETKHLGRVLVLDGIVQTTEKDEFMYHEMLVHVPMYACADPKRVLVVGGGDGGSLREVLKHGVERVDMVEIDRLVVDLCVEHLPTLNLGGAIYHDVRVNLVIDDAFEYLKEVKHGYDVIIVDSTDPIGAAEVLFSTRFYQLLKDHLRPDGIISLQNGVPFLQPDEPRDVMKALSSVDLKTRFYTTVVPSYYGGQMTLGFAAHSKKLLDVDLDKIQTRWQSHPVDTRCYSADLHAASFVLPKWLEKIIAGANDE